MCRLNVKSVPSTTATMSPDLCGRFSQITTSPFLIPAATIESPSILKANVCEVVGIPMGLKSITSLPPSSSSVLRISAEGIALHTQIEAIPRTLPDYPLSSSRTRNFDASLFHSYNRFLALLPSTRFPPFSLKDIPCPLSPIPPVGEPVGRVSDEGGFGRSPEHQRSPVRGKTDRCRGCLQPGEPPANPYGQSRLTLTSPSPGGEGGGDTLTGVRIT
jgi:hypothetical protein